jgi:hypothetical protein
MVKFSKQPPSPEPEPRRRASSGTSREDFTHRITEVTDMVSNSLSKKHVRYPWEQPFSINSYSIFRNSPIRPSHTKAQRFRSYFHQLNRIIWYAFSS